VPFARPASEFFESFEEAINLQIGGSRIIGGDEIPNVL